MAIQFDTVETFNPTEVAKFERIFDKKILETAKYEGGLLSDTIGDLDNEKPGFRRLLIVAGGTMSKMTAVELRKRYEAANWEVRDVGNSGDREERPGLVFIEFWLKAE